MKKTQLYDRHVALGGRIVEFAGWQLPVQYPTGPIEEHHTVRRAAGLFDIDHMGQLEVRGPDALPYLQKLVTWDVSRNEMGEAHYAFLCYDDGGIVDDIFVYRLPGRYMVVINGANVEKDYEWARAHTHGFDVEVTNLSPDVYMLAFQGPKALPVLQKLTRVDLSRLTFHYAVEGDVAGIPTVIGRTGYTGEDGFELFFPAEEAVQMWDEILRAGEPEGVRPIGLAARDSLRFEPCLPLYGQEIGPDINPFQARLGWAVRFDKGDFIGREALLKAKLEKTPLTLVGFEMVDPGVPRHLYKIAVDGLACGEVTTGNYSPTLGKYLGLGFVPREHSALGTEIEIVIRGKPRKARIVKTPFYTPAYRRQDRVA
jgi:aminomethyltransferase